MAKTTQNELTDALTSAISAIADSSVQSKDATLTIEAEVVEVIDEGLGTYKVKYLGNQFEATTAHTEITYQIGDMVYVVVPNGNFDKNKIILSPVNPSAVGYAATASRSSGKTYINISDNLFDNVNDISMSTWKPIEADRSRNLVTVTLSFKDLFNASLKDSRTFNFSCKIRTDIEKEHRLRGDYGLELHLPVLQNINGEYIKKDYVVKIDTNNITGDPYNLQEFTLQNIYFTLPEDMTLYSYNYTIWSQQEPYPWISYFVKDFIGIDQTKPDDIFITNIQLLSVLEINEENMPGYYVVIKSTEGNSFLTGRTGDQKTLSVLTFLNGKQTKNEDFACYWFRENVGINKTSNKYHRLGGQGWEILNKVKETSYLEDGKPVYEYVTNDYTQIVLQNEIHYDTVYKCILAKDINTENPVIKSATVTIKNLANNAEIKLETENGSTVFSKGIGNMVLQLLYYENHITNVPQSNFNVGYYWQKIDRHGDIVEDFKYEVTELNKQIDIDNKTFYRTKIKCPVSDIDEVNIYKCTVYIEINKQLLIVNQVVGTVSLMVTTGQFSNGHIEVINDNKLYKYDADGNSPMSDGQYSGPLTDFITSIDPISIRLYKGDGNEFTSDEYAVTDIEWLIPINSMILPPLIKTSSNTGNIPVVNTNESPYDETTNPGYYTISGKYNKNNSLNYRIANTYSYNKTDNTIIIKASTPSTILKEPISEIARLTFLKDGEGGTNGTSFSTVITYNDYRYGENNHKFQMIYAADTSKWFVFDPGEENNSYTPFNDFTRYLIAKTYLQGEIASNITNIKWTIFDAAYGKNNNYSATSPISVETSSNRGRIFLNGNNMTGPNNIFCATVQAEVTCTSSSQSAPTIIYAYYPIECIYIAYESYLESFIPYLKDGFSKVLYGSDGSDPKYDQKSTFKLTNYYYDDIIDYFSFKWTGSPNMTVQDTSSLENKAKPKARFDNGISNNYIKVSISATLQNINKIDSHIRSITYDKQKVINEIEYYQMLQDNLSIFTDFENNYYYYKTLLTNNTTNFYLLKTNLVKISEDLLNLANEIQTTANEYKIKEDGSTDTKINNVSNAIRNKLISLDRLNILCSQLGVNNVSNQIKTITPIKLVIEKISYNNELPERDCYYTINNIIDLYNYTINNSYNDYLTSLNDSEILREDEIAQLVFNWLNNFILDERLDNLTKSKNNFNQECYRYTGLLKALEGRVNSASEQVDTYSYNLIIENILDPIYNDLVWYCSFTNDGGYNSVINELNEKIAPITNEINLFNNYKTMATEMYYYNRVNITCCRPIIMTYNRYEMSFLNGWDGNKLQTGDGFIIAPQVGAGIKNSDNSFTGIVLGTKQIKENTTGNVGLFGYNFGVQTLFLNARNGSATFGSAGAGQIILAPSGNTAIIKSGNYNRDNSVIYKKVTTTGGNPSELGYFESVLNESGTAYVYVETTDTRHIANKAYYKKTDINGGMQIDLSTPEIRFGTGNFVVTEEGHITAKGGGSIAGWDIDDNNLYSKAKGSDKITIHSGDGYGHWEESVYVYDYPCVFSGTHNKIDSTVKGFYLGPNGLSIKANSGAHFELNMSGDPKLYTQNHQTLNSSNTGFYLGNNGFSIGSKVYIDNSGIMRLGYQATDEEADHRHCWTIDGYNSAISYGTQGSSGSVYIGIDKLTLGKNFSVTNDGKLTAKNAEITGKVEATTGKIASWKIDGDTLKSENGNVKLNANSSKTIEGYNGTYIDVGGGGNFSGCHLNGDKVVFSVSDIGVTRYRNDETVLIGHTGDLTFVSSVDLNSGTVETTTIPFLHGLWIN